MTPPVESEAERQVSYQNPSHPPNAGRPRRLLADGMLGTLAKWLRLLGYDTYFDPALDDHALARLARAEGRILLTRDRALAARRGLQSLFVQEENLEAQIAQVVRALGPPSGLEPRCAVCNGELAFVPKAAVRSFVPPYVFHTQSEFRRCTACGRIYWRGTHWTHIAARLTQWQVADVPNAVGDSQDE